MSQHGSQLARFQRLVENRHPQLTQALLAVFAAIGRYHDGRHGALSLGPEPADSIDAGAAMVKMIVHQYRVGYSPIELLQR